MSLSKSESQPDELIEQLAALEHRQWVLWSRNIAKREELSAARMKRWKALWIPYERLTPCMKEQDRIWARRVLAIVRRHQP
jgi:hypothetical protein